MDRRLTLWFTAPGRVELVDEALPPPGAGQVAVRTLASAIGAGTELLAYRGELPPETALDETLGALGTGTFRYPFRYGYASVGEVMAVGAGVDPSWRGRRAFAFEPHATRFVAAVGDLVPLPEGLAPERAVLLAHMETAVNLILDGAPLLGEQVLVLGQGTVGLLVTALLARFPLARLLVHEPLPLRAAAAQALGGRVVAPDDFAAALGARGADLVYELSGSPAALDDAIAAAGHEARVVIGSWYGTKRANVDLGGRFHRRRLRLVSSQVSHIGAALSAGWDRQRRFDAAFTALRDLDTAPIVSHTMPFARAAEAYALLDQHPERALQVLLTYGES